MKKLFYLVICIFFISCKEDMPESQQEVIETSNVIEITTPMIFADEDYQGELSSYFYDWNGTILSENIRYSIKSDGTMLYTSANLKGEFFYLEEGVDVTIIDPGMPTNTDPAVIDEKVYLAGFGSVFESDRKLYVYQLEGESFQVLDSTSVDVGIANIRLVATEGIDGELMILVYVEYQLGYVYRFKNSKLELFVNYPERTDQRVVFPFKGDYLEYTGVILSRLDIQGNTTTLIEKEDLELPDELEWDNLYFSKDLILIDLKEPVNTERAYALVYDGKDLMQIEVPLFYSSGGHPIHTPFNKGNKYLHYDPATSLLDVYFSGTSTILFKNYDRVYKYQMTLGD